MSCPSNIPFGMENGRGFNYNFNSGREVFRCGFNCVKIFITNVSVDKGEIIIECFNDLSVVDNLTQQLNACPDTISGNARDRAMANWCGKRGANSGLPSGSVLTTLDCGCSSYSLIITHTEGGASVRGRGHPNLNNARNLFPQIQTILNLQLVNEGVLTGFDLSPSPTEWLSFGLEYSSWKAQSKVGLPQFENSSLNFNNMQLRRTIGITHYDDTQDFDFPDVVDILLSR